MNSQDNGSNTALALLEPPVDHITTLKTTDDDFMREQQRLFSNQPITGTHERYTTEEEEAYVWIESSTTVKAYPELLHQQLDRLFLAGREETFEDGMESSFSRMLLLFVREYGDVSIKALADLIIGEKVNPEVAAEALRWLGHLEHQPTYCSRLWLLEASLVCSSARIRDGAVLGIASMDDPSARVYLERAARREEISELRTDMEQVLKQLER